MWIFAAWLTLLLLQWSLLFAHPSAVITAIAWTAFVVKVEVRKQKEPTVVDAQVLMACLLVAGCVVIFAAPSIAFSLWLIVQIVSFFYFAHQNLPKLQPLDVLTFIVWGFYVVLTDFTTFAAYSAVAWLPKVLYALPYRLQVALGAVSIVGSYVEADTQWKEFAAGALLALNFCSATIK